MNIILEDAIKASKTIILGESLIFGFSNYSPSYFSTTECIRDYLDDVKYEKTRALTVLASGDHIFSLINKGILNIDAFDINFLAYYTYHLRKAMILGLSREEFIDVNRAFVSTHDLEANLEFINELKDLMPDDVYQYYDEMLRFCLKLNPYLFKLLYCGYNGLEGVSYLDNDEEYERVREGLKIANINLFFGDVDEIAPKLSEKYDIILLSNIADYLYQKKYPFGIEDFKEYLLNFARLLNKDGVLINYIFSLNWRFVINGTNITKEDLADNLHLNRTEPFDNNEGYYLMRK